MFATRKWRIAEANGRISVSGEKEAEYVARRAREERSMEAAAADPAVKKIHRDLAEAYEARTQILLRRAGQ